jgi:hypothetical protein
MLNKATIQDIAAVARQFNFEPAALLAVAEVESGGQAYAVVDDRPEPLIRFEGHYFDRRLTPDKQLRARAEKLASPIAGKIPNPRKQAGRWRLLERAAAIDRKAAYESVSWGLGQVMGAHWAWLGFESVDALVEEARNGVDGQARLMARYIEKAGLAASLTARNWNAFARGYNGPDYRRYRYHTRLATAYLSYRTVNAAPAAVALKLGDNGLGVRRLQVALTRHGHRLEADGLFGRRTERAVREFQRVHGLLADGVVDDKVHHLLTARPASARSAVTNRLLATFKGLFKTA